MINDESFISYEYDGDNLYIDTTDTFGDIPLSDGYLTINLDRYIDLQFTNSIYNINLLPDIIEEQQQTLLTVGTIIKVTYIQSTNFYYIDFIDSKFYNKVYDKISSIKIVISNSKFMVYINNIISINTYINYQFDNTLKNNIDITFSDYIRDISISVCQRDIQAKSYITRMYKNEVNTELESLGYIQANGYDDYNDMPLYNGMGVVASTTANISMYVNIVSNDRFGTLSFLFTVPPINTSSYLVSSDYTYNNKVYGLSMRVSNDNNVISLHGTTSIPITDIVYMNAFNRIIITKIKQSNDLIININGVNITTYSSVDSTDKILIGYSSTNRYTNASIMISNVELISKIDGNNYNKPAEINVNRSNAYIESTNNITDNIILVNGIYAQTQDIHTIYGISEGYLNGLIELYRDDKLIYTSNGTFNFKVDNRYDYELYIENKKVDFIQVDYEFVGYLSGRVNYDESCGITKWVARLFDYETNRFICEHPLINNQYRFDNLYMNRRYNVILVDLLKSVEQQVSSYRRPKITDVVGLPDIVLLSATIIDNNILIVISIDSVFQVGFQFIRSIFDRVELYKVENGISSRLETFIREKPVSSKYHYRSRFLFDGSSTINYQAKAFYNDELISSNIITVDDINSTITLVGES